MKKIIALATALLLLCTGCSTKTAPSSSQGAQKQKIGVIQLLEHPSLDEVRAAILEELKVQGYDESKVEIQYQSAQNDGTLANSINQKFVGDQVDVIIAIGTSVAQSAAASTGEIPIVFAAVTDPEQAGLLTCLDQPEGNITGTSDAIPVEKIFALADELTPGIQRYGFLYNPGEDNSVVTVEAAKAYLDGKGIDYVEATATNVGEVTQAAQSLTGKEIDAIFVPIDNTVAGAMPNVAQIAIEAELPCYVAADSLVNDGGLATVGVNYTQLGKQTGQMVAKVLAGTPISEIPVEILRENQVVVNPETARALGIDVSQYTEN